MLREVQTQNHLIPRSINVKQHSPATKVERFSGEDVTLEPMHETATIHLNEKGKKCASYLQDQRLLAKLSAG